VHGPLHVRGAICLVNSVNERDFGPQHRDVDFAVLRPLLEGTDRGKR
jgi:hypothetical protein